MTIRVSGEAARLMGAGGIGGLRLWETSVNQSRLWLTENGDRGLLLAGGLGDWFELVRTGSGEWMAVNAGQDPAYTDAGKVPLGAAEVRGPITLLPETGDAESAFVVALEIAKYRRLNQWGRARIDRAWEAAKGGRRVQQFTVKDRLVLLAEGAPLSAEAERELCEALADARCGTVTADPYEVGLARKIAMAKPEGRGGATQ